MKAPLRSLTAAVLLTAIMSSGSAVNAQGFTGEGWQQVIVDVRSLDLGKAAVSPDRDAIQPLEIQARAVPLRESAQGERQGGEGAILVDSLALDTQVLAPPDSSIVVRGGRAELPAGKTHLSLSIDGKEFVLYVVETVNDRNYPLRHVTAAIIRPAGGAYARFTVDDRAHMLVGTLKGDISTYRIFPSSADPKTHLVYRLVESPGGRDRRFIALSNFIVATPAVAILEERHILAEALAEFQPAGYYIESPVAVSIWGQEGGNDRWPTMDPTRAEDPDAISVLIGSLAPLTGARGDEQLMVERVQPTGYGVSITFRQLLRGLPVGLRQTLELTGAGNVRKLRVSLLDESWLPDETPTLLTSTAAESLAREALAQHVATAESSRIEKVEGSETMTFDVVEFGSLAPRWRSSFLVWSRHNPTSYSVSIDLRTGESLVVPMRMRY